MFFKEKIYRKELYRFIIEGILGSVVFGSALGAINFFLMESFLDFFNIFTFIILYYFLVKRLYESFHFYHITYSILAIFFLFLGDYFVTTIRIIMQTFQVTNYIWLGAFNPLYYFSSIISFSSVSGIIISSFNIFINVLISYMVFMRMKR